MKQSLPLVTVVGLCYNHSRFVLETLESIRQQIYPNLQVILIDDCSSDDSVFIIDNWLTQNNLNWLFIKHNENKGISKSLNETVKLAKGKYYKCVACDDLLLPNFIASMVDEFEKLSEDFALLYSDVKKIDEQSNIFGSTPFTERGWVTEDQIPSGNLFDELAAWCFIPAPSTFFRTSVLKELPFDEELRIEDWDMWLRISKIYKIKGLNFAQVHYRIHPSSFYQQKSPLYRDHELRILKKHLGYSELADARINDFIYRNSILLYMHNGDNALYWLWTRFLIQKSLTNFIHVLLALCGITYEQKERWKKIVRLGL